MASRPEVAGPVAFLDDDGNQVVFDADEARTFIALTGGLDPATVSACPQCAARVLACVAVVDLLESAPPHPRSHDLLELADEAPTLHLYVVDLQSPCRHPTWRDPGFTEWRDATADVLDEARWLR